MVFVFASCGDEAMLGLHRCRADPVARVREHRTLDRFSPNRFSNELVTSVTNEEKTDRRSQEMESHRTKADEKE